MIYPFKCPKCSNYIELVRPSSEASDPAYCTCGENMKRVWTAPQLTPIQMDAYYSPAHGQMIGSKSDLRDANKKYADRTGSEMVEVGTGKPYARKKKSNYEFTPRERHEIAQMIES